MDRPHDDAAAPELLTVTANLLHESTLEADPKADMLLLFLLAGLTVLGCLLGAVLGAGVSKNTKTYQHWMFVVLTSVCLGEVCGCAVGFLVLGARVLVRWERRHHSPRSRHV